MLKNSFRLQAVSYKLQECNVGMIELQSVSTFSKCHLHRPNQSTLSVYDMSSRHCHCVSHGMLTSSPQKCEKTQ